MPGLAAASVAFGLDVLRERRRFRERVPEQLEILSQLERRGRAAVEQALEQRAVVAIEREDQREGRVPPIRAAGDQQVAVQLLGERALKLLVHPGRGVASLFVHALAQPVLVEHQDEALERAGDEVLAQLGDAIGGGRFASLEQHLEPGDEALGVEGLALARALVLEEVFVERGDELLRGGERDQLAGVFEPHVADELRDAGAGSARTWRTRSGDSTRCVSNEVEVW